MLYEGHTRFLPRTIKRHNILPFPLFLMLLLLLISKYYKAAVFWGFLLCIIQTILDLRSMCWFEMYKLTYKERMDNVNMSHWVKSFSMLFNMEWLCRTTPFFVWHIFCCPCVRKKLKYKIPYQQAHVAELMHFILTQYETYI